jgi:flagellar motor protein MotB
MKKILMSLVTISAVALLGGCVSLEEHDRTVRQLEAEQQANVAMAAENARLQGELSRLRTDRDALQRSLQDIRDTANSQPSVDLTDQFKKIWGDMGRGGEFEQVRAGNAVGVRLDDSGVLFASGSWTLTDNTKSRLSRLAEIMKPKMSNPNLFVRIDGHTDTDPIRRLASQGIKDNVHLSTMRAMAVRDFLASQGLPKERVFVAGFGEHWPIAAGNTAAAKQRNRRVEVYMGDADALSIGSLPSVQVGR